MLKYNYENISIRKYPDDEDLLEDVIIENKQAIEMANIYSNILSGTMDAFASIISNNLNIVMKLLGVHYNRNGDPYDYFRILWDERRDPA